MSDHLKSDATAIDAARALPPADALTALGEILVARWDDGSFYEMGHAELIDAVRAVLTRYATKEQPLSPTPGQ